MAGGEGSGIKEKKWEKDQRQMRGTRVQAGAGFGSSLCNERGCFWRDAAPEGESVRKHTD